MLACAYSEDTKLIHLRELSFLFHLKGSFAFYCVLYFTIKTRGSE